MSKSHIECPPDVHMDMKVGFAGETAFVVGGQRVGDTTAGGVDSALNDARFFGLAQSFSKGISFNPGHGGCCWHRLTSACAGSVSHGLVEGRI